MTLGELTMQLGGKVAHGTPDKVVTGVNGRERATATELLFAEDAEAAKQALASAAAAVVVKPGCIAENASD